MRFPFGLDEFLDVFRRYNEVVWPAPWMLLSLAVAAVMFALRSRPGDAQRVSLILAVLWLWTALAYHLAVFASVTRSAIVFAALFVVQAALFVWLALRHRSVVFRPRLDGRGVVGAALIAYALVGYPMVSGLVGHDYPAAPTFGVPCPTTIFTLGLLAWALPGLPRRVLVVPVLWALVGVSAVVNLGMIEDLGLPLGALALLLLTPNGVRLGRRGSDSAGAERRRKEGRRRTEVTQTRVRGRDAIRPTF